MVMMAMDNEDAGEAKAEAEVMRRLEEASTRFTGLPPVRGFEDEDGNWGRVAQVRVQSRSRARRAAEEDEGPLTLNHRLE
jgi:hypothetical protein